MTQCLRSGRFVALCFATLATISSASAAERPNVLFIMVDDLGKDWISCYGADDIETPHIDALAAGGMKFNNAWSMPQCTPTRATLLTGQYPWRTGWVNHWDVPRWGVGYFDWQKYTTFAELMKSAGYRTAIAGKWQINDFRLEPNALKKHGFDDWCVWTGAEGGVAGSGKRYADPHIHTRVGTQTYEGKFGPALYCEFLIEFMKEHHDHPMMLYFPMALTHSPLVPTPLEPNAKDKLDKHKAMVRYTDHLVGRLVETLDELEIRDDTVIVFTTDNGTSGGIRGEVNGQRPSGGKGSKFEGGVCEPFIVNYPKLVPGGVTTDALTDFSDLLPTFLELGGVALPQAVTIDGKSFAPLLLGKADDSPRDWIMALGHGPARLDEQGVRGVHDYADRVIRDKQFKVWVEPSKEISALYDLLRDPLEKNNLLESDKPEHLAALKKFQAIVDATPDRDARPMYRPREANPWDRKLPGQEAKGKANKKERARGNKPRRNKTANNRTQGARKNSDGEPPVETAQSNLDWKIASQDDWLRAAAEMNSLEVVQGVVIPTADTAHFRSRLKRLDQKCSAASIEIEPSPIWQNWDPIENIGPVNLKDAPVLLCIEPGNYWMFGMYGKTKGKNSQLEDATLAGFDVPLKTSPHGPNQFDAPGGLKSGLGGYHAWQSHDMVNWVHHGPVTEKFSKWVISAEYADGKTYLYYDYPNDQDPHLYIDEDLTDGAPGENMGMAFRDPSDGSDSGFIRDKQGRFHVIYEDWSPINAGKRSWDSPLAGHAVSDGGIGNFKILPPAVDNRTKPTGKFAEYKHPHWLQHPDWDSNIARYEIHEPEQEAYGDWAPICIGTQYYLFGDFDPVGGHRMSVGWFTSPSIDDPFTWCDNIGEGHPDPDIGFAEGRFYLVTQQKTDYVSPGPWVRKVEARVGVDTKNDGSIDHWTDWQEVKESYSQRPGFAKQIDKTTASMELKDLPAGFGFAFELRMTDTTANQSKPMIDRVQFTIEL